METNNLIYEIPLKHIRQTALNARTVIDDKIHELAESIKKYGLLQPIILRGKFGSPPYEVLVGKRRFLAHKSLGLKEIKAIFREDLGNIESLIISLSENMLRVDLNFADKAKAITKLYLHFKKNVNKVAKETGISKSTIRDYIKIEEQASDKMKSISKSKVDMHRALKAANGNTKRAEKILELFSEYKFSKNEKERAVEYSIKNPDAKKAEILEEVETPKKTEVIVLGISSVIDTALKKAKKVLSLEKNEIAVLAIEDWLRRNGFLN